MQTIKVPIKELKANDKNPRKITKVELNKLVRSIQEFGFVEPIIVNQSKDRYNIVIGGHQRLRAAKKLGMKEVPCVYVDLIESKEHLLNIALNEISGDWDDDKLFQLLKELQDKGADLTLTGFDEPVIDEIMSSNKEREKESTIDIATMVPDKPKSKPGEVYLCGHHKVMCGDSTGIEDFEKLMNGKIGDGCFTDPPYGVSYKGTNNPNGRDGGVMKNDDLREEDLYKLLLGIYTNTAKYLKPSAAVYTCYASGNHVIFEKALNDSGLIVKQQLIWEKGHVLGHSDYHWCHEPILYCKKKGESTEWFGDRTHKTYLMEATIEQLEELTKDKLIKMISSIRENSDIIHLRKDPSNEYLHSTQKPVGLSLELLKNNTRPGELIIEPCGGSGSTLIACESSGRICYCMEIDCRYIDVILNRWSTYAEKVPIRESDGKVWSEIKDGK